MNEWLQLANTTGVALAVLAAVGIALYKFGKLVTVKALGDEKHEGWLERMGKEWTTNQKDFFDSLKQHNTSQHVLCERHAESLESISALLMSHDQTAKNRDEAIRRLLTLHEDKTIPHSTAEAIETVRKLRHAALATCTLGRDLANGPTDQIASTVCRHCDAIEQILKEQT